MKKKPIVYKIVSLDGRSAFTCEGLKLEYRINKTTYPKIGLIFAFDSVENARKWLGGFMWVAKIYECRAEIAEEQPTMMAFSVWDAEKFWSGKSVQCMVPPRGTVFCKSVTPIRLVRNKKSAK